MVVTLRIAGMGRADERDGVPRSLTEVKVAEGSRRVPLSLHP
jgi:hypothetical protein